MSKCISRTYSGYCQYLDKYRSVTVTYIEYGVLGSPSTQFVENSFDCEFQEKCPYVNNNTSEGCTTKE